MHGPGRFLRLFSCVLVLLVLPATSVAATPQRGPVARADAVDTADSPLDLRAVTFGQRGTQLILRITTDRDWELFQLSGPAGRALCVDLYYGSLATPRSRVCFFDGGDGRAALSYTRLDPFGGSAATGVVRAGTSRPDKRTVQAIFDPSAINLGQGRFAWRALSKWSCEPAEACDDAAPDNGGVIDQITPIAEPPCFGAASRNPRFRCSNPALRYAVVPPPDEAVLTPNAPCAIVSREVPYTCQFGVRGARVDRTIALIGDSHATHWRGALEVVAQTRGWSGYSLTRAGCPLSTATPDLDLARRRSCASWRRSIFSWFGRHPAVRTVFVSQLAGLGVRAPRGQSRREYEIAGFLRAWQRLPKTVREIVVLRDTPVAGGSTPTCIRRAMNRHQVPGTACAIARARALRRDPAAIAALRRGTPRVHLVDLTKFICSRRLCFPVVGGVLVHKDLTHLTPLFAETLGPFLLQSVNRMYGSKT